MKTKKKLASNKINQLPSEEEFMRKHNQINLERIPNFHTYFVSMDQNDQKIENTVNIKTWEIKAVHDLLEEQSETPIVPTEFEINYVKNG